MFCGILPKLKFRFDYLRKQSFEIDKLIERFVKNLRNHMKGNNDINGWIFLDKPIGISSNRALQKVRKIFHYCKAGYVGTLDPLASGFLPIALGKSTKTIKYLSDFDKEYVFEVTWGMHSSTGDLEGDVKKIIKFIPR